MNEFLTENWQNTHFDKWLFCWQWNELANELNVGMQILFFKWVDGVWTSKLVNTKLEFVSLVYKPPSTLPLLLYIYSVSSKGL